MNAPSAAVRRGDRAAGVLRRHPWRTGTAVAVVALVVLAVLFEADWLSGPAERALSSALGRPVTIGHLAVRSAAVATITLRDVSIGNLAWAGDTPLATVRQLDVDLDLRRLLRGQVVVPRVVLDGAQADLRRSDSGASNWSFGGGGEDGGSASPPVEIQTLVVRDSRARFRDPAIPIEVAIRAETLPDGSGTGSADADYRTELRFDGTYHDGRFEGSARVGEAIGLRDAGTGFPFKGELRAPNTRLRAEGRVANLAGPMAIDVALEAEGSTLASLYPFLLLPLPASPPYRLAGQLTLADDVYRLETLKARVGSTDLTGQATYTVRQPRPLLEAQLASAQLVVSDLGPLVGIDTQASEGKPRPKQAELTTRPQARRAERRRSGDRVLPAGDFEAERLRAIDAKVTLTARRLKITHDLPLESLDARLALVDGRMTIAPLRFGFAGGQVQSAITLDAHGDRLASTLKVDMKGVRVAQLTPASSDSALAKGAGRMGASVRLAGAGDSIADAAAAADGSIGLILSQGRLSNLLDAASGLNFGKALLLLIGGDQTIAVRCGAVAADVKGGRGTLRTFVIDTEESQITGAGGFNLADESFGFTITPLPKSAGFLSARTPLIVDGTLRDPDVRLKKGPLAARAGIALALAAIAPPAALLALIEPGPGEDADCGKEMAAATQRVAPAARPAAGPRQRPGQRPAP